MIKAVDLSKNNVVTSYEDLKKSIDCTILKIIRKDGNLEDMFLTHYNGCKSAGLPIIGVYNYSYATTPEKGSYDAALVVNYMKNLKLYCAVWLDIEDKCVRGLGHTLIDIINEYKKVITINGYPFGIYCDQGFYNSCLKPYANEISNIPIWIARYYAGDKIFTPEMAVAESKLPVIPNIVMWQYSSHGLVNGIKGNVDINKVYYDAISAVNVPEIKEEVKEEVKEVKEETISINNQIKSCLVSIREGINGIISLLD